ncbi:hypothetical protein MTO96_040536 [Rhipicephalus appendiculatus]
MLPTSNSCLDSEYSPVSLLIQHVDLIWAKQADPVAFDRAVENTFHGAALKEDNTAAFEYEKRISSTKTSVCLATEARPRNFPAPTISTGRPTSAPFASTPPNADTSMLDSLHDFVG